MNYKMSSNLTRAGNYVQHLLISYCACRIAFFFFFPEQRIEIRNPWTFLISFHNEAKLRRTRSHIHANMRMDKLFLTNTSIVYRDTFLSVFAQNSVRILHDNVTHTNIVSLTLTIVLDLKCAWNMF